MKLKLIFLIFTYFVITTNTKNKLTFKRAYFTYFNKSRMDVAEMKMTHLNKTFSVVNCKCHFIRPITHSAKVNIKAYFIRNNVALFSGIQFDVPFCKALSSNAFGVREMIGNFVKGDLSCPIKPGWYTGNFRFDFMQLPYGTPVANYMVNASFVENDGFTWIGSIWFEITEEF